MKKITQFVHRIVIQAKAEEFFVGLRQRVNIIRRVIPVSLRDKFLSIGRFIPSSAEYSTNDSYSLTRDNTNFIINRSDYVQWRLFYGVRDNALLAAKEQLTSNSIVLDIGSNFGAFSLRLATYAQEKKISNFQIHAFEPNPAVVANYENNLALNTNLKPIIQLHGAGLGNENGERSFSFQHVNTGVGRVLQNGQFNVKIQRLDDFIEKLKPEKIAFIKLIVEGFEPEVLKGGWNTIMKYKPPIFLEVTPTWWKENQYVVEDVLKELAGLGYSFMIEHFNEMLPYEPSKYSSRFQFNLLATIMATTSLQKN